MKISIIIPAYNVEKYIERCIKSILAQEYQDYEIIIVNDGSKDKTGEICDYLASDSDKIFVAHIPNGGVANARNVALEYAKGEYIWFIDSDDFIIEDSLSLIVECIEKNNRPEILIFDAKVSNENDDKEWFITCDLPEGTELCFDKYRNMVMLNTSLWNRVYKKELIERNQICFESRITIAEDLLFNYKLLLYSEKIYYINQPIYHYIQRNNSAMSGAGKNKDVEKVFEKLIDYYKQYNKYECYKQEIEYLALYHYFLTTNVRMIRCGQSKEELLAVREWFKQKDIQFSINNKYICQMALKHILVFILLKYKCYKVVSMLFSKF